MHLLLLHQNETSGNTEPQIMLLSKLFLLDYMKYNRSVKTEAFYVIYSGSVYIQTLILNGNRKLIKKKLANSRSFNPNFAWIVECQGIYIN